MKHKILLVLLLSSMACITATAQKVSMDFRQVKLAKVFDAITQQTGLTVAYSRPTVNPDKLVTVRADEEELAHVLDRLLAGMGVTYETPGASRAVHASCSPAFLQGVWAAVPQLCSMRPLLLCPARFCVMVKDSFHPLHRKEISRGKRR